MCTKTLALRVHTCYYMCTERKKVEIMEILTNRELRANLKHYSDRVREGESFQIGETTETDPTAILLVNRDIAERLMIRREILTRYSQLLQSCDLSQGTLSEVLALDTDEVALIDTAITSLKEVLNSFIHADLFEKVDTDTIELSNAQKRLLDAFDLDDLGYTEPCINLTGFLIAMSMVESAFMMKRPTTHPVDDITKDLLSAVGRLIFGVLIAINPNNTISALDGMGDDLLVWIETHITQVRMQTKRIDGIWQYIPVAKGRMTFIPDQGEEEYV